MANVAFPKASTQLIPQIIQQQGLSQLWRGVMPMVYKSFMSNFVKILFYDKIKHSVMPYDVKKYSGLDFYLRASFASVTSLMTMALFTYPFDLYHTRATVDMTLKGKKRLYESTFQVFNKCNLNEGRAGMYKGIEYCLVQSLIRASLTLPVYDLIKRYNFSSGNQMLDTFQQRVGASMVTGLLLSLLLYPLDTMKRTAQLSGAIGTRKMYWSSMELMKKLPSDIGLNGLYRGAPMFLVSSTLYAFAQLTAYDLLVETRFIRDV